MKNVSVIAFYSFFRIDDLAQIEKQVQNFFQPSKSDQKYRSNAKAHSF